MIKRVCIIALMSFSLPFNALAQSGIPTFDVGTYTQMLEQVSQMREQVQTAKNQYEQMRREFEAITGNSQYGRMLANDDLFTYIPESGDWREVSGYDIGGLAERYGLTSDDPARQEQYERELSNMVAAERSYRAQTQRLANIEALMGRADTVQTPRERDDLANAIAIEQAALQVETNRMAALQDTMLRDSRLEEEAANNRMSRFFE